MSSVSTFPVIIPAAGIGSRMAAKVAKQYLQIGHKTVLEHSIDVFLNNSRISNIIVVVHPQDSHFASLSIANHPKVSSVIGGSERADSVLSGLRALSNVQQAGWVLVHDAARPCLQQSDLNKLIESCEHSHGGILGLPVVDTIKQRCERNMPTILIDKTIDRSLLWQAQTPQMFKADSLIQAIESAQLNAQSCSNSESTHLQQITDEASAMEMAGHHVQLVEGQSSNIKITRPSDLALAKFYLASQDK